MESRTAQLNKAGELTADAAVTDMEEYTRLLLQKEKLQKECVQLDMEFDELFGPLILEEFQAQIEAAVTDMEEYTRLLLQKEKLQKECVQLDMEFDELFGPLILEEFQAQIELVRQKIELSLYIKAMNQGQDPDPEEIEKAVAQRTANWQKQLEEMAEYQESLKCRSIVPPEAMNQGQDPDPEEIEKAVAQRTANWQKQLEEMAEYQESLKCRSIVPPEEMRQISRLYRKMVKMIHPDLHPELEHDPRIRELWDRLQTAYRLNALDEMEEIAVLIHEVLADSDTAPVQIPDLTEKIEKLRQELHTITTTDPWLYSTWIYDTVKRHGSGSDPGSDRKNRKAAAGTAHHHDHRSLAVQHMDL